MSKLTSLPVEILVVLSTWLSLQQILQLCASSRHLRKVYADIRTEKRRACVEALHNFCDRRLSYESFPHAFLLMQVLTGEIPPQYIKELDSGEDCYEAGAQANEDISTFLQRLGAPKDYDSILRSAINESPWIREEEVDKVLQAIYEGDGDTMMAVLIPLLLDLRRLDPPQNGARIAEVLRQIAYA